MKVAIDIGGTRGGHAVRGIGMYTNDYIKALERLQENKNLDFRLFPVDSKRVDLSKYDLVHYTHFHPYFINIPLFTPYPSIVTIHDLIQIVYKDQYPGGVKGNIKFNLQKIALRTYKGVVTITETSKKDIVRFLGVPEQNIAVVSAGVKSIYKKSSDLKKQSEIIAKYNLPKKFVLYVGDVNYTKNLLTLAEACVKLDVTLVISGKQAVHEDVDLDHVENRSFSQFLKLYKNIPKIMRLGFVPDEDLLHIYNLASVYCQPSYYEGFGMPVLEAFACETPVVVAKTQALVEVARDAALVCDPFSSDDMAKKIKTVIGSSAVSLRLIREGKKRLEEFSWDKTASLTYDFYKRVLNI